MDVVALLTSAGINIAVCVVLVSLYSILRKQPGNGCVYFTRRIFFEPAKRGDPFCFERLVPSASWIMRAWRASDEEILAVGGVDAAVFMRIVVFSIRVFTIAAMICIFLVLPINYYGQEETQHKKFHTESLDIFTIENVKEGSKWLWTHCFALYIISCAACVLLYFEYKSITKLRVAHITESPPNPSHFTVLVRGIPSSHDHSYSDSVKQFFSTYYPESYVSHQMAYRAGTVDKLMDAEKMYRILKTVERQYESSMPCCLCGGATHSFKMLHREAESVDGKTNMDRPRPTQREKERSAAFVFFRSRHAALVAAQALQSPNPMLWVTQLAPEPRDVYWSNFSIPYGQVWLRKVAILLGAIVCTFLFVIPVGFVQGLTQLDKLSHTLPFLTGILKQKYINKLVTGYLPSVIITLCLYAAPPIMMLFSTLEGNVSRTARKRSACIKLVCFTIWNLFFVNVFSGSVISQLNVIFSVKNIPTQLAKAVPAQNTFFITFVLTSGWASLSCELMQPFALLCLVIRKYILRIKEEPSYFALTFPHHTEIPRLLLFGLIGFTCSVMAPLILPFLLVYFSLAFLVYRNQILHVYVPKYESGGLLWPIVHNTTIFSLVVTQLLALGVFGIKRSPVASGFTIPLILLTLLFNEYCRQRFSPVFKRSPAQLLIEMDRRDEEEGRLEEIINHISTAYRPCPLISHLSTPNDMSTAGNTSRQGDQESSGDPESLKSGNQLVKLNDD